MLRRSVTRLLVLGVAAATTLGVTPAVASAATFSLVSSTPADKSIVQSAASVKLCFSATVNPVTSTVTVNNGAGVTGVTAIANCTGTGDGLTFTPTSSFTAGDYTVTYSVNDTTVPTALNAAGTLKFRIDTTAPATPIISAFTHPVNSTNVTQAALSGTAEPSTPLTSGIGPDTITVSLDASVSTTHVTKTTTTDSSGNYSFSNVDLTSLPDGTVTYSVTAKDTAGNTSSAATQTATKDVVVPNLISSVPAAGGTHQQTDTITLTFDKALDHANSSGTVTNGVSTPLLLASTTFPSADVMQLTTSGLMKEPANPYTVNYSVADTNGNPRTGQFTFTIDDTAPAPPSNLVPTNPINIANVTSVGVSGSAESGSTVNVDFTDGTHHATGSATATGGSFAITGVDASGLTDGSITVNLTATDAAGNVSNIATTSVTKDTVAPAQPTGTAITPSPVNHSNETLVTVSATVAADVTSATISIDDNADPNTPKLTTTGVTPDGNHLVSTTFDVTSLDDGTLTASVVGVDGAGNPSTAATTTATKDAGVPAMPTVTISPKPINASTTTVTVSGTAEKSSAVHIVLSDGAQPTPNTLTFDTVADGTTGAYTHGFAISSLVDGTITATVTATDAVGNTSPAGTDSTTKDTVTPNPPANLDAPAYANIANSSSYPISGTAEPDSTVTVTLSDDSAHSFQVQTTAAHSDGSWSISPNLTSHSFADGGLHISVTATDAAGNASTPTTADRTKDTVAPAAARIDSHTNPVNAGNQTAVGVAGTAGATESGAGLMLSIDDANDAGTAPVTASMTAANDGSYSFTNIDVSSLDDGQLTFTLSTTDVAGNPAATTTQVTSPKDTIALALVSRTPASSPTQSPSTVTGTFNEPLDTGTSTITVADKTDSLAAGVTSFSNGNKTIVFTPSSALSEAASPYTVTITGHDAAGDSPTPTVFTFTVDNTPPAKPVVSTVTNPVNAANQTAITVTGTAEPNSTITLSITDGTTTVHPTGAADDGGAWSINDADVSSLADGTLTVTATATDAAGNTSVASDSKTTQKDATPPAKPVVSTVTNPITASNFTAVAVSGTAEDNASVTVTFTDGTNDVLADTSADSSGNWSVTGVDLTSLSDGTITVTAIATDAAGNDSVPSDAVTTPKHTVVPSAPQSLTITPGDSSLDISWAAPATDGGSAVTSYTVTVTPHGSVTPAATVHPTADTTEVVVSSLTNGTLYDVAVTATNGAGTGPAVSGSSTPRTTPGAPTGVHVAAGDTVATVSWTAPASDGGAAIDHYTVRATPNTAGPVIVSAQTADGTARSLVVHGLVNGVAYAFTVIAHNVAGDGPASSATGGVPKFVTHLTIADTHGAVVYGNRIVLSGKLTRSTGAVISRAQILVYRMNDNHTTNHIATVSTGSTGTWSYSFVPAVDGTYYVRFLGDSVDASSGSGKARTTVAPNIKITSPANKSSSSHTTTLTVKGTVGPNMTGKYVSLNYINSRGALVKLQAVKLTTGSVFAFSVKLARGTWRLEVLIGATPANVAGHSPVLTVFRT